MPLVLRLVLFRLALFAILGLGQVYIVLRLRRAIRARRWSRGCKALTVGLAGLGMGLFYAVNLSIVLWHLPWVDPPVVAQLGLIYPAAIWSFGATVSAAFLLLADLGHRLSRSLVRRRSPQTAEVALRPADPDRRRFLRIGMGSLASAPLVLSGYGAAYASRAYGVEEVAVPFGRSLTVVQLSDMHAGLYMTREDLRRYVDLVDALRPDLLVLTGDFISNSMSYFAGCAEEMARIRTRYGTFATLGNHEHWYGNLPEIRTVLTQQRITLLNNAHRLLRTDQGPFAVAGIDDSSGHPDLARALYGLAPDVPTLLLSHRPEIFPRAAAHGIPLTLSGHWHGGQIKLSLLGFDVSVAHVLSPYPEGLYRLAASHLYVNRGIGTTGPPIRLNAAPEVTLIQLT